MAMPVPNPSPQVMGLVVPGSPVRTDFIVEGPDKLSLRLAPSDFPAPLPAVAEIILFLLPGIQLPPEHGVLCFWQIQSTCTFPSQAAVPFGGANTAATATTGVFGTGFELLGALTPTCASGAFPTKWSENLQVGELCSSGQPLWVTIGVSIEPLTNIHNLAGALIDPYRTRLFSAERIARDLFTFMQSFDTGAADTGNMVVPHNIFDRWLRRFENRFRRDPNFFLRSDSA